ncbi:MAG: 50S ribosomal protein L17 [Patescibacteria group bacterium]
MKHRVSGRKLSRDTNSRKALLNNLANSLFLHGQITTTLAKAKFARSYVEKTITSAKKTKLRGKRKIASTLSSRAFLRLINEIAPGFEQRTSGYTRILKIAPRKGDNAPMAKLELVAWDKTKIKKQEPKVKAKRAKNKKTAATPKKPAVKKTAPGKKINKK